MNQEEKALWDRVVLAILAQPRDMSSREIAAEANIIIRHRREADDLFRRQLYYGDSDQ